MAQEIADSKLIDTWGSSGTKIEPDISKIIEGWQLGEQPPHEYMNWLQNTFGSKLNHILKNGIAKWDDETEYLAGASVQHSGSVWLCETTNTKSEPTDLNANWEKVAINKDLTVTVDTLADLRSISYPANTVWASGYHSKNDGAFGSHIFRLKGVKTTETDNGGTVIIATIGGVDYVYELQFDGAVKKAFFGVLNFKDGIGTEAENDAFTGAPGEITVDTTNNRLRVHDGISVGGKKVGNIEGNADRDHFAVGCIPRYTGGAWTILNDSGHNPLNVTTVSEPTTSTLRINYNETATKINNLNVTTDETLAQYGVVAGASVGTSYADIAFSAPFSCYINGTSLTMNELMSLNGISASRENGMTIISHPTSYAQPVVSINHTSAKETKIPDVGYDNTKITIKQLADISGYFIWTGTAWSIQGTDNSLAECNYSFTAPTTGGTIVINHTECADVQVQLTSNSVVYDVCTTNLARNFFEVAFINRSTGLVVTTPNTNMKLSFRRKGLVVSPSATGGEYMVQRNTMRLNNDAFALTGSNFWVTGMMEK